MSRTAFLTCFLSNAQSSLKAPAEASASPHLSPVTANPCYRGIGQPRTSTGLRIWQVAAAQVVRSGSLRAW
jgi:hypothetical protein